MDELFHPRGVAVIGAQQDEKSIGGQPVHALRTLGFEGSIYPVNPKYDTLQGLRCYRSISEIVGVCDVALIAVRADLVPNVIGECKQQGISYAIVLSAGFGEAGADGIELENKIKKLSEDRRVRIVGPNCQGLMTPGARVFCGFGAPFQHGDHKDGHLAMVTQSGGFGYAAMGLAEQYGVGFKYVVSTGNEADLTTLDFLDYFLEVRGVDAIASYLEGINDGRRLVDIGARALAQEKPILVWKVGTTEHGRRAAATHTASKVGSYEVYQTAFRSGGFIEVTDVYDLVDITKAFACGKRPEGNRVGVISISGGASVLLADCCVREQLQIGDFSAQTEDALGQWLPAYASIRNPLDTTANVFNEFTRFTRIVRSVAQDENIDIVIICAASVQGRLADELADVLITLGQDIAKPVLVTWSVAPKRAGTALKALQERAIPVFPTPTRAARAAGALAQFFERRRRYSATEDEPLERVWPKPELQLSVESCALCESEAKAVLNAYGIRSPHGIRLAVDELTPERLSALSFPVVLKAESSALTHKTEAHAVQLNLNSYSEVAKAAGEVLNAASRHAGAQITNLLIEEQVSGVEVIVGSYRDEAFGHCVICGLGGIYSELMSDVGRRLAPFGVEEALQMINECGWSALLDGYRNTPIADKGALAEAIARVSWLVTDYSDVIAQLDINPIIVGQDGEGVWVADALIVTNDS